MARPAKIGRHIPERGALLRGRAIVFAVATAFAPSASSAEDRPLVQLAASAGAFSYVLSIPAVDLSGSSLSTASLKAVVDSGSLAELATISASQIAIPAVAVTVNMPDADTGQRSPVVVSLADIVFSDVRHGRAATMAIGSISLQSPWGALNLDKIAARDVDVATTAGVSLVDVSFSLSHPQLPERRIGLLNLAASFAQPRNGIPTAVDIEGIGLTFDVPANPQNSALAILRASGLSAFSGTFRIAAEWNESQNSFSIVEVSLTERTLGGLFLAGEITEAGKALFSTIPSEARAAAAGLAVRFLTLSAIDSGLGNRLAAHFAKRDGSAPDTARAALARSTEDAVTEILSSSDDAAAVGAAVRRFAAGESKGLDITIQAKTPPGIALSDIRADVPALLQRVRIDAEAK